MSSPRAARKSVVKTAARPHAKADAKTGAKTAVKAAIKPAIKAAPSATLRSGNTVSADAVRLAAEIEHALADGRHDLLTPEALQALMAAACKTYAARLEAGNPTSALSQRTSVTPTEVMVTASGLLKAANLAVFELGMWQSWTGR